MYLIMKLIIVFFVVDSWLFIWVRIMCWMVVLLIIFFSVWVKLDMIIIVDVLLLLSWCLSLCGVYNGLMFMMIILVCKMLNSVIGYCNKLGIINVMWLFFFSFNFCCK